MLTEAPVPFDRASQIGGDRHEEGIGQRLGGLLGRGVVGGVENRAQPGGDGEPWMPQHRDDPGQVLGDRHESARPGVGEPTLER